MVAKRGLILYVHGARDPRWAEPFVRLRDRVAALAPQCVIEIAYLEHTMPDLPHACASFAAQGIDHIRVVPMFFGRGGHLREDFPRQLDAARRAAPTAVFEVTEAAGESSDVLDALAHFAVDGRTIGPDPT